MFASNRRSFVSIAPLARIAPIACALFFGAACGSGGAGATGAGGGGTSSGEGGLGQGGSSGALIGQVGPGTATGSTTTSTSSSGPSTSTSAATSASSSSEAVTSGTGGAGAGGAGAGGASSVASAVTTSTATTTTGSGGASAAFVIHEFYVDRNLSGDSTEWVEISGAPGAAIEDLRLRHHQWVSAAKPTVLKFDVEISLAGGVLPASGHWVVGGVNGPTNYTLLIGSPDNFGLDNTSGTLQLYRASTGELLDAVGYGKAEPADAPSAPKTTMFGSAVALPPTGSANTNKGVSRLGFFASTDSSKDYCVQLITPKADNSGACL